MSEATTAPRFSVELRSNNSSAVVASATYDEPAQALQAYRDATEAFRAAKMPPGSSLSLNDQRLELHAGAVSEGLGVIRHSWAKESAREQFDKLSPSKDERPEQAALRAAFAGKAAEASVTESTAEQGAKQLVEAASVAMYAIHSGDSRSKGADMEEARRLEGDAYKKLATVDATQARSLVEAVRAGADVQLKNQIGFDEAKFSAAVRAAATGKDNETPQTEEPQAVKPGASKVAAESVGGTIENIERTARSEATAEGVAGKSSPAEKEEREDSLRKRYFKTAEGYHDKQTLELVIQDKGSRLTSTREDTATVDAIATAAIDRGWVSVGVSGSETFKREAWYQLSVRGVEVTGYSPTAADKERLNDGLRAIDPGSKPYTDSVLRDVERRERERAQGSANAENKVQNKEQSGPAKSSAEPPMRSPVEEASKAVRLVASDMAVEGGPSMPREQLAVSAAANQAYGAAVAANERDAKTARAADKTTGVSAPVPAAPVRAAEPRLSSEQQVMVAAVDRALRDGGMSQEQRDRVNAVVRQNVAEKNPSVQVPKVADRSAIPQPAAAPAPQKQAKRDFSR